MRRRITIAILGVVLGTLVLTVAASVLLVQGAAISTGESELTPEGQALGQFISENTPRTVLRGGELLRRVGAFDQLKLLSVNSQGAFSSLPPPLQASGMNSRALLGGETVTGNVGHEIFVAVPLVLTARERIGLRLDASELAVLVITKHLKSPVNGIGYFLLVGGVVLVLGAAVAALLAENQRAARGCSECHRTDRERRPVGEGSGQPS